MLLEDAEQISDDCLSYIISSLPPRRREKAENYFFRRDRANCAAAYALMRYMLMRFGGVDVSSDWEIGKNGKPYLPSCPGVHFNISHCEKAVACALHSSEIGVDVQDCISDVSGISSLVLCERELELLSTCDVPEDIFSRLWSIKESCVKCLGDGISDNLRKLDFSDLPSRGEKYSLQFYTQRLSGIYLSVCSPLLPRINLIRLSPPSFLKLINAGKQ